MLNVIEMNYLRFRDYTNVMISLKEKPMKLLHCIPLLCLFLFSCKTETEEIQIVPFEFDKISADQKMQKALSQDYLTVLGISEEDGDFLNELYKNRQFKPFWMNDSSTTELGQRLSNVLKKPEQLGIPTGRNTRGQGENFVQEELLSTLCLAKIINDLDSGIINYDTKLRRPNLNCSKERFEEVAQFDLDSDLRYQFLAFGPQDTSYQVLGKGLIQLMDKYPMDTATFEVHSIKKDTAQAILRATEALVSKGYMEAEADTSIMFEALKTFQEHNGLKPDGIIGKYTSKALNESTEHKRDRIILAMDKLRNKNRTPKPEKYIHINIPEYKLRFYINDSLKSDHNIVVGKYENQTPELTSKLRKIVAYPYWNVPYSISSKEILPAAKRNSEYFAKHNYKIYKSGEEVDPLTVDWKRIRQNAFPYKVVQDPGRSNSLGIIKFDFYNEHSVYFHDTPSKALFGADVRAYSHGCMRTQHPVDLARVIIERDRRGRLENEIIVDSLDSIMERGDHRIIKLIDPIPIFVEYQTVARKGMEMITYVDIYGRDEEYLKIMRD